LAQTVRRSSFASLSPVSAGAGISPIRSTNKRLTGTAGHSAVPVLVSLFSA